jgi:proline iminopeptidase
LYYHRREVARTDDSLRDVIYSAGSLTASLTYLSQYDMRDRLKDIEAPVLVLSGRDDWITPLEYGSRVLANGIPNAELVVFEESGHMPFIEERTHFLEVMAAWLGRLVKD